MASPRSAALAALRSVSDAGVGSPAAVRSGTSRRNQARTNATPRDRDRGEEHRVQGEAVGVQDRLLQVGGERA